MITARNYAAQAERELQYVVDNKLFNNNSFYVLNIIKKSVHFALPDNGRVFNDNAKGLRNVPFHLPFPEITVEFFVSRQNTPFNKALLICKEVDNKIEAFCAIYSNQIKSWHVSSLGSLIACENPLTDTGFSHKELYAPDWKEVCEKVGAEFYKQLRQMYIHIPLVEMLEALTCKNVYFDSLETTDENLNKRRIKAGKLPLYETKILCIKSEISEVDKSWKGGSHASPRQHLRRGHIRRLEKGNVWINNCVVGKKENGIVSKSYEVC